jgi:hypothetical protein
MNGGNGPPYRGRSESKPGNPATLEGAIADAWDNAKGKHADVGWYSVHDIKIQTTNPIHAYVVLISPTDPPGDD